MSEQTKAIKWWNTHTTEQCFNLRKSLLNESLFGEVSKCACPPLVACEICGEEKNLDGDFWKNKKKHDC